MPDAQTNPKGIGDGIMKKTILIVLFLSSVCMAFSQEVLWYEVTESYNPKTGESTPYTNENVRYQKVTIYPSYLNFRTVSQGVAMFNLNYNYVGLNNEKTHKVYERKNDGEVEIIHISLDKNELILAFVNLSPYEITSMFASDRSSPQYEQQFDFNLSVPSYDYQNNSSNYNSSNQVTCGMCNGTGRVDDYVATYGNTDPKYCSACGKMMPAGHCHGCKTCPSCGGKGVR